MVAFYTALISSIFVSNSILSGFKGMCSYLGISKNRTATFVCVISGLICWGLGFLLRALDIYFMFTIVAILVIASLVQFVELVIKKFVPSLYKSLGIYLPLITTNCVVLGLALSVGSIATPQEFGTVLGTVIGVPLGYFLVIMLFSAIQERLLSSNTPKGFKGAAIGLITTALMALAFYGFAGTI